MILLQDIKNKNQSFDEPIYRENIMTGILVKNASEQNIKFESNIKNLEINTDYICRKILFYRNSYGIAIDLLYNSPYYKVEGYDCGIETKKDFLILNPIELN